MQVHNLTSNKKRKNKKRIGRGGKRGTYSGRGIKGQKSRAGRKLPSREREVIARFPKLRGVKNPPLRPGVAVVNVSLLNNKFEKGEIVNKQSLIEKGVVRKGDRVKILGSGEIKIALTIEGLPTSGVARNKIEKAKGRVVTN